MSREQNEKAKFEKSLKALEHALSFSKQGKKDPFYNAGIAKSFEICLEHAWKYLKSREINEGLEVFSPKDAIKQAGRMGLIDDVEKWLDYLEDRNLAVHDYLGISDEAYVETIQDFAREAKKLA